MEIIIALLVVAGLAFYLIRKNKEVEEELQQTEAAYKVEAPVVESIKVETPAPVEVTPASAVVEEVVDEGLQVTMRMGDEVEEVDEVMAMAKLERLLT